MVQRVDQLLMLLYGGTLAFNLIWFHAARASLLAGGLTPDFIRDVNIRYLLGLLAYAAATLLALIFAFGTSVRPAFRQPAGRCSHRKKMR